MGITAFILSIAEIFKKEIEGGIGIVINKNLKLWSYLKEWGLIKLRPQSSFDEIYNHTLYELHNNGKDKSIIQLFDLPKVREAFKDQWYRNEKELLSRELDASWHTDPAVVELKNKKFDFPKEMGDFIECFRANVNLTRTVADVEDSQIGKETLSVVKEMRTYLIDGREAQVPLILTLPPPKPEFVVGRDEKIEEVFRKLNGGKDVLLVNGIGGIGKTVVGLEFVRKYRSRFDHVAWIEVATTIPDAFTGNAVLLDSLGLTDLFKEIDPKKLNTDGFRILLARLNNIPGNNLLLIDNANDYSDLLAHRNLFSGMNAKVIFTTRAALDSDISTIRVDELSSSDALKLFQHHYSLADNEKSFAVQLLEKLEFHTLLIELVAKAGRKAGIHVKSLYEMVNEQYIHNQKLNLYKVVTGQYGKESERIKEERLENYIRMTFRKISDLTEDEKKYLRYFSMLPSEEYSIEQLKVFFDLPENEMDLFAEATDRLFHNGWLSRKLLPGGISLKMHSLILDTVVSELKPDAVNAKTVIACFTDKIRFDPTRDNPIEKFQWIKFGDHILEKIPKDHNSSTALLKNELALLCSQRGEYQKACTYLEDALKSYTLNFGENHPEVAIVQSNLALVYQDLGDYEKARDLLEKALKSDLKNFGELHPNVARSQSNLATVYKDLGDYEKARDLLEKALKSDLKNFGEFHPTVAVSQSNLATVYKALGDYEKARDLLEKALKSDLKNFGEFHPTVAVRQSNLALVYQALGDYEKARDLLEKALKSDLKNFGELHPNVAIRKWNLGTVYIQLNDKRKAKELIGQAYDIFLKKLGREHPHTVNCKQWLDSL